MGKVGQKKGKRDFWDNLLPTSAEDGLNLALKTYFQGFARGEEHENHGHISSCARSAQVTLHPRRIPSPDTLRYFIGDLLKARVKMRKALQLQRKKKELFESARNLFEGGPMPQLDQNGQSEYVERKPWQLLLHKGAPGTKVTTEFRDYNNAQLVSLPLLRLMSKMTDDWKRAHRNIVKGVRGSPLLLQISRATLADTMGK